MDSILRNSYRVLILCLTSLSAAAQSPGDIENQADTNDINICQCISGDNINFDYFSFYFDNDSIVKVEIRWEPETYEQNRGYLDDLIFVFSDEPFTAEFVEENLYQDTLIKTLHILPEVHVSNEPIGLDFLDIGDQTLVFKSKSQWSKRNRSMCLDYVIKFKEEE